MKRSAICLMLGLSLAAFSCANNAGEVREETVTAGAVDDCPRVDTLTLRPSVFAANIVSNGKIRAGAYADLAFRNADLVADVFVHNGQHVQKGQPLAVIDTYKLDRTLRQQESDIARAELELQDVLIGQGYDPARPDEVPADIMKLARIRSGLDKAEAAYETTCKEREDATLTAPFSGVVANVTVRKYSVPSVSEPAMRIIDDGSMTVAFPVLDSEIGLIQLGDEVEVTPFSGQDRYKGRITEINPIVEENGQIQIRASLDRSRGLIDGLGARVKISRKLDRRLVVPKKAVVLRSGRQVVFTWEGGKALWNYVTTGAENFDSYVIEEGLRPGQIIIVDGNEDLAHESPVVVVR